MSALEPIAVSVKAAVTMTGLSVPTLYRMFNRGELETLKIGKRRLVKISSINQLMGAPT